jgi:hypothetical protein
MHRELEWPVSKATCLYKKLYMMYSFLYTIIEGTSSRLLIQGIMWPYDEFILTLWLIQTKGTCKANRLTKFG